MFIDFERQATANLLAFYTNQELAKKKNVLLRLIEEMSKNGVVFALSCSGSYFFRGLIDDFHDYDIVVEEATINKFIDIFVNVLGGKLSIGQNGKERYFDSKVFCSGEMEEVEFDIISKFTVITYNTRYEYDFKACEIEFVNGIIPVCPVESSLLLYGMMIQWQARRRYKYQIALNYLRQNGVSYPEILKAKNLPKFIQDDIKTL